MNDMTFGVNANSRQDLWKTGLIGVAMIAAFAVWWQWQSRNLLGLDDRLLEEQARHKSLKDQLSGLKPPDAPACPPGSSVKTLAADAQLPPEMASAPSSGKPHGAASSTNAAQANDFATVLPDYALAQKLEQSTALVMVDNGKTLDVGSGFFISPNLLVTNRHVIDHARTDNLRLVSGALGRPRRATVLQSTKVAGTGSADFALLRMEDGLAPGVLQLSTEIGKLGSVVAAGYPQQVMKDDVGFRRMLQGDMSTPPDLNLTQGAVQSLLPGNDNTQIIVHTASINHGNSGGPLVDACGRAVGVNTYIGVSKEEASKINYAIRSATIQQFLQAAGVNLNADLRVCGQR